MRALRNIVLGISLILFTGGTLLACGSKKPAPAAPAATDDGDKAMEDGDKKAMEDDEKKAMDGDEEKPKDEGSW